ncbi:MAG: flagellar FliJ family protein [Candidatus Kapaibacterium sp.]
MAKKFNFRLQPVLKYRAFQASQAENELGRIVARRIEKERGITERMEYIGKLNKSDQKFKRAADFQAMIHHKNHVRAEIKKLNKERQQLEEIENLRRQKLTEAMRKEKALEKLKEKKLKQYKKETDREETEFLDELSIKNHRKADNPFSE